MANTERKYYIVDTAGRVWCGASSGFTSYHVNAAFFMTKERAEYLAKQHPGATVHSRY